MYVQAKFCRAEQVHAPAGPGLNRQHLPGQPGMAWRRSCACEDDPRFPDPCQLHASGKQPGCCMQGYVKQHAHGSVLLALEGVRRIATSCSPPSAETHSACALRLGTSIKSTIGHGVRRFQRLCRDHPFAVQNVQIPTVPQHINAGDNKAAELKSRSVQAASLPNLT